MNIKPFDVVRTTEPLVAINGGTVPEGCCVVAIAIEDGNVRAVVVDPDYPDTIGVQVSAPPGAFAQR